MQTHAAVFRTGSVLLEGCQKIDEIYNQTEDLKVRSITNSALMCVRNSPYRIYARCSRAQRTSKFRNEAIRSCR